MNTAQFVSYLRDLHIKVWVEEEQLHFRVPRHVLTPQLKEELHQRKAEILSFLQEADKAAYHRPAIFPADEPIQPARHQGVAPMSFAQQRLWFLDQLEPDSPVYNIPMALRLQGKLANPVWEKSLNMLRCQHESLRTTFASVDNEPSQVIHPYQGVLLPVVDLQRLSHHAQTRELKRVISQESLRPFSLRKGRLLRALWVQLAVDDQVLFINMHHIISDGWSMYVFTHELTKNCQRLVKGEQQEPETLPIQYADFAIWQRNRLQGERLADLLAYWQKNLAGVSPLTLPTDYPRPPMQTFKGRQETFALPLQVSTAIKQLAQREGSTVFMVLLAAFLVLLARYSGQDDIAVGSPTANRNRCEIEPLIGLFVNTLILRTDLSGNPTFRQLLQRVREVALGAFDHQELPFEKLVEELQTERDLSRNPLFQVMFDFEPISGPEAAMVGTMPHDIHVELLETESQVSKFDLTCVFKDDGQTLLGNIEYNTDLFGPDTIVRMKEQLQTLLANMVHNPDQSINTLAMISPTQRHQLLVEWNQTAIFFPRNQCIHHLVAAQAAQTPDAIALIAGDHSLTYAELNGRANQLASYLRAQGVGPESLVAISLERSLEMVIGLLGVLKAGGAYVPVDPVYPAERFQYILEDTQARLLLTQERLRTHLLALGVTLFCLDSQWHKASLYSKKETVGPSTALENAAYVIYTSGSTGQPKGVLVEHRALVNHALAVSQAYGLQSTDRLLQFASMGFDVMAEELFPALVQGAAVVLHLDGPFILPSAFTGMVQAQAVTALNLPATYWHEWVRALSEQETVPLNRLRMMIVGSETVSPTALTAWHALAGVNARWWNAYGPTETTVTSTLFEAEQKQYTALPIGRPIANVQVYILDRHFQPVPIGLAGNLYIGGAGLSRGYLQDAALTASRFVPDPFSPEPGARLYQTGDRARYHPDGQIDFLGRSDYQVKIRGFRIELGEIEAALMQLVEVHEAIVLAHEDQPEARRLVAYVVAEADATPTVLRAQLATRLPAYLLPQAIVLLPALPLLANGKVDRQKLSALADRQIDQPHDYTPPRTLTEERLAEIWTAVLGVAPIGIDDNFFELGGHSLLAIQLMAQIQNAFQVELSLRLFFEQLTIARLAENIDDMLLRELEELSEEETLQLLQEMEI